MRCQGVLVACDRSRRKVLDFAQSLQRELSIPTTDPAAEGYREGAVRFLTPLALDASTLSQQPTAAAEPAAETAAETTTVAELPASAAERGTTTATAAATAATGSTDTATGVSVVTASAARVLSWLKAARPRTDCAKLKGGLLGVTHFPV
jgi:hypothetical protein